MGSTVATLIAGVRRLLRESAAVEWEDEDILRVLRIEYRDFAAALGMLPGPGWFTQTVTFTMPANTTEYDLTDSLDPAAGTFAAIKTLYYRPPVGRAIPVDEAAKGQEELYRLGPTESPVGQVPPSRRWLTRPAGVPTLNAHAESNVARDFIAHLRYEPPEIDDGDTVETAERHDDVLVMGAVLRALLELEEEDPAIERRYERKRAQYLDAERNAAGEFESETTKVTMSDTVFGGE